MHCMVFSSGVYGPMMVQRCVWVPCIGTELPCQKQESVSVFSQKAKQTLMLWVLGEISGNFTLYYLILGRVFLKSRALCKFLNLWNKRKFPLWVPIKSNIQEIHSHMSVTLANNKTEIEQPWQYENNINSSNMIVPFTTCKTPSILTHLMYHGHSIQVHWW